MAGLLAAFVGGAAEFGAGAIKQNLLEIALQEREERLAEIAKAAAAHSSSLTEGREVAREGRAKTEREELGAAVTKAKSAQVDDLSGTVRDKTPREMLEAEREVYAGRGLVDQSMRAGEAISRDDERRERALDRSADNQRADRQLEQQTAYQKGMLGLQGAQLAEAKKSGDLDRQIKQVTLDNNKRVDALRVEFAKAETTPERKNAIREEIQLLSGKDNDKYLPVPLKDEMGNVIGYKIFDTKAGDWKEPKAASGEVSKPKTQAEVEDIQNELRAIDDPAERDRVARQRLRDLQGLGSE